jgi:hypothetical protein
MRLLPSVDTPGPSEGNKLGSRRARESDGYLPAQGGHSRTLESYLRVELNDPLSKPAGDLAEASPAQAIDV